MRRFPEKALVRLHYHDSLELNLCRNVRGQARVGSRLIDLTTNPVLVLPPRTPHAYSIEAGPGTIEVVHLAPAALAPCIDPAALTVTLAEALTGLRPDEVAFRALSSAVRAAATGCGTPAVPARSPADSCTAAARALDLVAAVLAAAARARAALREGFAAAHARDDDPADDRALRILIDLAEARAADPPSLSEAAAAVGRSRSSFCRWFRECTGATWASCAEEIRLEAARRLIESGSSAAAAAAELGYADPSHFCRRFKARFGDSPGSLRGKRTQENGHNT